MKQEHRRQQATPTVKSASAHCKRKHGRRSSGWSPRTWPRQNLCALPTKIETHKTYQAHVECTPQVADRRWPCPTPRVCSAAAHADRHRRGVSPMSPPPPPGDPFPSVCADLKPTTDNIDEIRTTVTANRVHTDGFRRFGCFEAEQRVLVRLGNARHHFGREVQRRSANNKNNKNNTFTPAFDIEHRTVAKMEKNIRSTQLRHANVYLWLVTRQLANALATMRLSSTQRTHNTRVSR